MFNRSLVIKPKLKSMFIYKKINIVDGEESGDWYQVGYYDPDGDFRELRKYRTQHEAEVKVNYLNGGVKS